MPPSDADATADPAARVPPGFVPHTRSSPLTAPWEPIFARQDGHAVQLGLQVREAHCNARGFAHGGLVCALADNAMGLSAVASARASGGAEVKGAVTVSLVLDFVDSARIGDWLCFRPAVLRAGRTLAFTEAHVWAAGPQSGERLVARASATFRLG